MKKLFYAFVLSLFAFSISQAQKGYSKNYNLNNFDAVDVGGNFVVKIKQSSTYSIKFVAEKEKDLADLDVEVKNGELNISYNSNSWGLFGSSNRGKINVYITMPRLESLDISGASHLDVYPFENIDNLSVDISGAAKAKLSINARDVNVDASGASHLEILGWVDDLNVDISGASHFKAQGADVGKAHVDASGASHANFGKVKSLKSETSGASHVTRS
jgi:hypothetical protein